MINPKKFFILSALYILVIGHVPPNRAFGALTRNGKEFFDAALSTNPADFSVLCRQIARREVTQPALNAVLPFAYEILETKGGADFFAAIFRAQAQVIQFQSSTRDSDRLLWRLELQTPLRKLVEGERGSFWSHLYQTYASIHLQLSQEEAEFLIKQFYQYLPQPSSDSSGTSYKFNFSEGNGVIWKMTPVGMSVFLRLTPLDPRNSAIVFLKESETYLINGNLRRAQEFRDRAEEVFCMNPALSRGEVELQIQELRPLILEQSIFLKQ